MKTILQILGSMTALFFAIAFFAVTILVLAGCSGPTEAQAEIDGVAWLIEAWIDDEVQRRLAIALAKGERL